MEELLSKIQKLEAKGKQNSGKSSKPPSSDLGRKRKPPVEPSGRKRGGQPGHAGQTRDLAPPEEVDEDLLGDAYSGLIHRDRWKPYEVFKAAAHQLCHSHIRRDFQSMLESMGETGTQGRMLKLAGRPDPSDRAFHLWHQFERGEISRKQLAQRTRPIQEEIRGRLEVLRDEPETTRKARGTAKALLHQWDSLWTYLHRAGAVPTNSHAERSTRKAVLWRKVSLGADSEGGCRFVARMLTVAGTAPKRGIDLLDWLTRAVQARIERLPATRRRDRRDLNAYRFHCGYLMEHDRVLLGRQCPRLAPKIR